MRAQLRGHGRGMQRAIEKFERDGRGYGCSSKMRSPSSRCRETMELLIIRHAIAFERNRRRWRDDGTRPLTPAGMRRSQKAAAGLKELGRAPDRLLTSPLVRARQTAQILTELAGWPPAEEA